MKAHQEKQAAAILVTVWGLIFSALLLTTGKIQNFIKSMEFFSNPLALSPPSETLPEGVRKEDEILLHGNPRAQVESDRWAALHDSDPSNPIFLSVYLNAISEKPDELLKEAQKLDPENGWFTLVEVVSHHGESIKKITKKLSQKERRELEAAGKPPPPSQFEILAPKEFLEAIDLLEKAAHAPQIDSYFDDFAHLRHDALPQAYNFQTNIQNLAITITTPSSVLIWKKTSDLLAAAVQEADSEAKFHRVETIARHLERLHFQEIHTLIDGLVYRSIIHRNSNILCAAAARLSLDKKAAYYRARELKIRNYTEPLKNREVGAHSTFIRKNASIMTGLNTPAVIRTVENPPKITREMLLPGVRVERALVSRVIYSVLFLILSFSALAVWLKKRNKKNPATFLVRPRLLLLGVLLPFLGVMVFRYFPGGMLNDAGGFLAFWNYLYPEMALLLILLGCPVCLLRQQAAPSTQRWKIWWPVSFAVVALVFGGLVLRTINSINSEFLFYSPILLLGICGVGFIYPILKERDPNFDLNGRLAPSYLFAAILVGGMIFFHAWEERYWFAQSDFEQPTVHGFSKIEDEIVEVMIEELQNLNAE